MIGQRDNVSLPMRSIHNQLLGCVLSMNQCARVIKSEYAELWPVSSEILKRSSAYLCLNVLTYLVISSNFVGRVTRSVI